MINWCLDINKNEAQDMLDDVVKMMTQILVIHFLVYAVDNQGTFLDMKTVKLLLYGIIAMVIYNLLTKRLVRAMTNKDSSYE